ncbi:phospholipase D-like domain-containing protein [Thermococcus sp. MAR1]|uniref:phospholipase D-like domain-containing protein n=1 Tax=Thermococcus sp. MAR1 TaxID=1638263 RepID=UPI00143AFA2E|nr:phospholipase D-like domain-containing protein [Thermococcus sp. MAR1]NJE11041.1 phospholipase [Thermococcus sp. MAR1]
MKRLIIPLLMVFVLLSAGCLGNGTTKTMTYTITATKTETETFTKVVTAENQVNRELENNLTRCRTELQLIKNALNLTAERFQELESRYEECASKPKTVTRTTTSTSIDQEEGPKVLLLEDGNYYRSLISAIDGAEESVYVMVFLMKYDPEDSHDHANDLIKALVRARKRGVRVYVLLEDGLDVNEEAYRYLKENGVDVSFDSPSTTLHAKVVIVDGRLVFIGSHNWSESALDWNHEVSVMVVSEELARDLIGYFEEVKSNA